LQSLLFFVTQNKNGSRNCGEGEEFTLSSKISQGSICNKVVGAGFVLGLDFHMDNVIHKYF